MKRDQFATRRYDEKYLTNCPAHGPSSAVTEFIDGYLHPGDHCLDLGCGKGRHSQCISKKGGVVTSIDLSLPGVLKTRKCLKEPCHQTLVADAHLLPFKDETFDSIICNRVLDYDDDSGLDVVFSEMKRVAKANAPIMLTVRSIRQRCKWWNELRIAKNRAGGKTYRVLWGKEKGANQHYFTETEIRDLAARCRFKIEKIIEVSKTNGKGEKKAEWQVIMKKEEEI